MADEITAERKRRKLERKPVDTLYVTDAELIRRMGVPEKIARQTIAEYDSKPHLGFPRKQPIWGNRRHWPSVKTYLERQAAGTLNASPNRERHRA